MRIYPSLLKPIFDLITAIIVFVLLSPLFIVILIILMFTNNGRPFFYQERPGKNEKIFKIIKFKTMNDKIDSNGALLPPEQRITKIGGFIRKYSLDEIPQLFNVIKGEMSLIGPRPLLIRYLPHYNTFQKQRHNIKPGITGWAQVNGRNTISWEEKFECDVHYANNISLKFDLKILLLTAKKLFNTEGIYTVDNEIVSDFTGTKNKTE